MIKKSIMIKGYSDIIHSIYPVPKSKSERKLEITKDIIFYIKNEDKQEDTDGDI